MTTQDYILSILSSAAVSGALVVLIVWLSREWMSARLKGSIQHEYAQKLEAHKAQLKAENEVAFLELKTSVEREAALHAAAHASFSEGQKAAMERKLIAVDRLWKKVMDFRGGLPSILTFIDVLTVDEYKSAKDHPDFQKISSNLSPDKLASMYSDNDDPIENIRPYVGEYMWAVFFSYKAIMIRLLFLLHLGQVDAKKIEWHKDSGIRQLMEAVLTQKEIEEFDATSFGKISWLQRRLESKILAASAKVISGEEFGKDSLKQVRLIEQLAAELKSSAEKPNKLLENR